MQILGKRSKILLIAVMLTMLVAVGFSFAMWDISAVKGTNGDLSSYANAKVGDVITFGEYYQDIDLKDDITGEYKKTPIEWIVVDKDERTGQLTLMSKYILACGSYFGNWYDNGSGESNFYYGNQDKMEVGGNPYNQAYVDSTARAFLNNLERLDMGGDTFDSEFGYIPSGIDSTIDTYDTTDPNIFVKGKGLLSSVGFSNERYWTSFNTNNARDLLKKSGFHKRPDAVNNTHYEIYYQRPIENEEYKNRPVTRGFYEEAFDDVEKSMIIPKAIAGYTGHRWPDDQNNIATKSYVEGSIDKVWLPSVTELNIMNSKDWNDESDCWTNPSDEKGSSVFEYFKNYSSFINPVTGVSNTSVADAIKTTRTSLAMNGKAGNYSIPVYDKGTTNVNTAINADANSSDSYWTRSPSSYWHGDIRTVIPSGTFYPNGSGNSTIGVRPCVVLKY